MSIIPPFVKQPVESGDEEPHNRNKTGKDFEDHVETYIMTYLQLSKTSEKQLSKSSDLIQDGGGKTNCQANYYLQVHCVLPIPKDAEAIFDMTTSWDSDDCSTTEVIIEMKHQFTSGSAPDKIHKYESWILRDWIPIIIVLTNNCNTYFDRFKKLFTECDICNGRSLIVHERNWEQLFDIIETCRSHKNSTTELINELKKLNIYIMQKDALVKSIQATNVEQEKEAKLLEATKVKQAKHLEAEKLKQSKRDEAEKLKQAKRDEAEKLKQENVLKRKRVNNKRKVNSDCGEDIDCIVKQPTNAIS